MVKRPSVVKQPEIGGLIREFCLLTGLTQEQFAAYLTLSLALAAEILLTDLD
ncbi:hypothetical protein [Aphanizomenon flos-aquae]|uniref:Transcriptional regulator n=1 Tax=Aphanizomenon flos-aquae FACHB-1040 TaxID=2692887 RepID=A0ABR8BU95_APHFL|nr:hypothetical protein [Aphanizomenon flos-aquae]MBD2277054.1 hypothetical protein [Aphanizomenon flos-aquae FACHB-1040]